MRRAISTAPPARAERTCSTARSSSCRPNTAARGRKRCSTISVPRINAPTAPRPTSSSSTPRATCSAPSARAARMARASCSSSRKAASIKATPCCTISAPRRNAPTARCRKGSSPWMLLETCSARRRLAAPGSRTRPIRAAGRYSRSRAVTTRHLATRAEITSVATRRAASALAPGWRAR